MIRYKYTHSHTQATTGYFTCVPEGNFTLQELLELLVASPNDSFLRRFILLQASELTQEKIISVFDKWQSHMPETLLALAHEMLALFPPLGETLKAILPVGGEKTTELAKFSPLVHLRTSPADNRQKIWNNIFRENIHNHRLLDSLVKEQPHALYTQKEGRWYYLDEAKPVASCFANTAKTTLPDVYASYLAEQAQHIFIEDEKECPKVQGTCEASQPKSTTQGAYTADEVANIAEERLEQLGIIAGNYMRHEASLSPIGLLRPWNVHLQINDGSNRLALSGTGTTYGRGLDLGSAKASCLMEMVERASVYLSIQDGVVQERLHPTPILKASKSGLEKQGKKTLQLAHFPLDVTYADNEISWIAGKNALNEEIYIPLQMAGLFCNLDEADFFDALPSTGIASHSSLEAAKLAALLEIIERDAESTTPYHKESCFTLVSCNPEVQQLLEMYKSFGVSVHFQDITGFLGVPAYQCFVMNLKGQVARGYGANLSAKKAIISALTETPFAFSKEPSAPPLRKLPNVMLEELPDYSQPTAKQNLHLLEKLLIQNNLVPTYADLTHKSLLFPVVHAFIEGMAMTAETDAFTKLPLRLWQNYLKL